MKERPRIKIELTVVDKIIEVISCVLLIAIWILTITNCRNLPETIPIHFDSKGVADGFGNKSMLFHLPIVASVIFIGLTILNKFPHTFNYLQEITIENAFKQYRNATRMMRVLKLIIVLIFGLISYQVIKHATGQIEGIGSWFLPFVMISIFVTTFYFLIKSSQT